MESISATPGRGQEAPSPNNSAAVSLGSKILNPSPGNFDLSVNPQQGIKRLASDERDLWTSPARIRPRDAKWLLMLGGTTASLIVADRRVIQHNTLLPANVKRSVDFSNYGLGALVGTGAGLFLWGRLTGDEHKQETGLLSGESALQALVAGTALGYAFGRQRPNVNDARGDFFRGGKSFPSDHSAVAWSIASTIAHEYPGPMTKILAYGLAGAVSASRVTGNQHFPSDVVVGGALGWLVARQVYQRHHNPDLAGEAWGGVTSTGEEPRNASNPASPYVPLDSWIYPSLERLANLGYIRTGFLGMRPWTRIECARLVREAGEALGAAEPADNQASRNYAALAREFSPELNRRSDNPGPSVQLESLYTRLVGISGQPLNDSYHFGQTLINDFGRPYARGFDPVSGFSGWTNWGRFALYVRGEYQHAPTAPAYPQSVRDLIAQIDVTPVPAATPFPTIQRFTLLDTYALTKMGNWNFSFGKQSLWWGPNEGGSLLMSNNAEPLYMFRVATDAPLALPGFLGRLGPVKVEAFMGKLSGNQFPPRPFFHGEIVSMKPTPNLELSFSRTAEFAGVGRPLTPGAVFNTYFGVHPSEFYPVGQNPGQRNGGFSMHYRVPGLRDWLTIYATLMSRDDITPVIALWPARALMNPGIYLSRIPHIPKLDFRAEGVTTNPRRAPNKIGQFAYFEHFYRDDYTNRKSLMGHWIGRAGVGYQLWSTYWFSPRTNVQFGYRHAQVTSTFIPHGGTLNDGSVKVNCQVGSAFTLTGFVQYENWLVTALEPRAQNNVTTALQITFWPHSWGAGR